MPDRAGRRRRSPTSTRASPSTGDGSWTTFGGTSWSAPLWAAHARPDQRLADLHGRRRRRPHGVGFAAPLLYEVASNPTRLRVGLQRRDRWATTTSSARRGGSYPRRPGYDLATGLGSPSSPRAPGVIGPGLAASLCAAAQGATTAHGRLDLADARARRRRHALHDHRVGLLPRRHERRAPRSTSAPRRRRASRSSRTPRSPARPRRRRRRRTSASSNGVTRHSGGVLVSVTTTDGERRDRPDVPLRRRVAAARRSPTVVQVGPDRRARRRAATPSTSTAPASRARRRSRSAASRRLVQGAERRPDRRRRAEAHDGAAASPPPARATLGLCQTAGPGDGPRRHEPTVRGEEARTRASSAQPAGLLVGAAKLRLRGLPDRHRVRLRDAALAHQARSTRRGKPVRRRPERRRVLVARRAPGSTSSRSTGSTSARRRRRPHQDTGLLELNAAGTELQALSLADPNPGPNGDTVTVSVKTVGGDDGHQALHLRGRSRSSPRSATDVLPVGGRHDAHDQRRRVPRRPSRWCSPRSTGTTRPSSSSRTSR